ncbi:SDR family NAD(P)-dependent oxidoreductase [Paraburkholderia tropica]|uniref:SDR family NAD(P)-dependent oxidoreductase n=1 Tax=Paraburkholderia tropica TaxID=92647 RepID=UPI0007ED7B5A|nr:glucose 1-dehydrogenase [Paraburkholderia tropica]OBR53152.1 hypothetical protein A6456_09320 [Paraburkholderia tropica]
MFDFKEKVVLVTGAAGGIGLETAKRFLHAGASVVLSDRNTVALTDAVQHLHETGLDLASAIACDISDAESVDALYRAIERSFSRLDIVVNNAGIDGELGRLDEQPLENIDNVFNVNIRGTTLSTRAALRLMRLQHSGVIVNVASIAGHVGFPTSSVYTASKHAILGLTKAAALECAAEGIRVCAVSPGAVDTDMTNRFTGRDAAVKDSMIHAIPLGRLCQPDEIANGILFMSSPLAELLVGQTLHLDGGWANVKP